MPLSKDATYQIIKLWTPHSCMNKDNRLETVVRSAWIGMYPLHRQELLWGPSGWYSTNSVVIQRKFLHGSRYTAAVMASSLAGACSVRGRPFRSAVGEILYLTWDCCSCRPYKLASGWHWQGMYCECSYIGIRLRLRACCGVCRVCLAWPLNHR